MTELASGIISGMIMLTLGAIIIPPLLYAVYNRPKIPPFTWYSRWFNYWLNK